MAVSASGVAFEVAEAAAVEDYKNELIWGSTVTCGMMHASKHWPDEGTDEPVLPSIPVGQDSSMYIEPVLRPCPWGD